MPSKCQAVEATPVGNGDTRGSMMHGGEAPIEVDSSPSPVRHSSDQDLDGGILAAQLVNLGISRRLAQRALREHAGDIEAAADWIVLTDCQTDRCSLSCIVFADCPCSLYC